jgi:hypothetical protein
MKVRKAQEIGLAYLLSDEMNVIKGSFGMPLSPRRFSMSPV